MLSCQAAIQAWQPQVDLNSTSLAATTPLAATYTLIPPSPSATATPSPIPATPTLTPTPTPTLSPTPRPTSAPEFLQVFEELWLIIKNEYLYADFNGLDWDATGEAYRQKIEAGLTQEEFYLAMDEMIQSLGDEHSVFLSPEDVASEDAEYAGIYDYVGIGALTITIPERQRVAILLIFPGSPAEEAGLKIHDSILEVNGLPILDENGLRIQSLQGPEGSQVTLTVQTPGQAPRQVTLTRLQINSILPVPSQLLASPAGKRVGYIQLTNFYDLNMVEQIRKALRDLTSDGPLDGLILDNRPNEGGSIDIISETLSFFTSGTLGHFINRQSEDPFRVLGENVNGSQDVPLAVLIGSRTASFGEIFAGILKDIGRAYLIGEQTGGNVEILYVYEFPDGSRAWIAHDTFRPLNNPDQDWEASGILPDLIAPSNWDEITMETDPAVKTALEYFDKLP